MKVSIIALLVLCLSVLAFAGDRNIVQAQTIPPTIQTGWSISDSSVYINEPFTLTLRMRRLSGDSGHGGISVSFPDFDLRNTARDDDSYASAQGSVTTESYTNGASRVSYFGPGYESLNTADGGMRAARYTLVETDDTDWPANAYRTLRLTVTPRTEGTHTIYYRFWLCGNGYRVCTRSPDTNQVDQQGWNVGTFSVTVRNRRPSVSKVSPLINPVTRPGDTQTFTASATDRDGNLSQVEWFVNDRSEGGESLVPTGSITRSFSYRFDRVGSYEVEAEFTDTAGDSDSVSWDVPVREPELNCFRDVGTLSHGTTNRSGAWNGDCASTHRAGSYARFYSFTLSQRSRVDIDLSSSVDNYLYLLSGSNSRGTELGRDDDGGTGTNARISQTLDAGTYTIEATTLSDRVTGNFSLSIDVRSAELNCFRDVGTLSHGTTNRSSAWNGDCASTNSNGSYARFYSFTLSARSAVEIDLTASPDALLFLLRGADSGGSIITSDDDGGPGLNSRIHIILEAGAYTIEATTFRPATSGNFSLSINPGVVPRNCLQNLGTLAQGVTNVSGEWSSDCPSTNRGGSYARFYFFTLAEPTEIEVNLNGTVDAYLYLLHGTGAIGHVLTRDDDSGSGANSRINIVLEAGAYTIEATTHSVEVTGNFTLSIAPASQAATCEQPLYLSAGSSSVSTPTIRGAWTGECASANRSGSYARYYTFTLPATADGSATQVLITLGSSVDTFLYLLEGSGTTGRVLASNNDASAGNTNSEISMFLTAGAYTVEATTNQRGVTGSFTLSVSTITVRSAALGNPTNLTDSPAGAGEIRLTWRPAPNADYHWVWSIRGDGSDGRWTTAGGAESATVAGLEAGRTYFFMVIAGRIANGVPRWSQWSNWVSAVPQGGPTTGASEDQIVLHGGSLNNTAINRSNPVLMVNPGEPISGSVDLSVTNGHGSHAIFPVGATTTWGPHENSFWGLPIRPPAFGTSREGVEISATAPQTPGVYAIIFAAQAETSLAHVMSATHWPSGSPRWNNGDDVAGWSQSQIDFAIANGYVLAPQHGWGEPTARFGAAAVRIIVTDPGGQRPGTPPAFASVSSGGFHTCGLATDGTVTCWGRNDDGQANPPLQRFTSISVGGYHTCGLTSTGSVACWGSNNSGASNPPGGRFQSVSAGWAHNCGLRDNGTVACWGWNEYGQATPPGGVFTSVSAGWRYSCGLRSDGSVSCWGNNDEGQANPPSGRFQSVSAGYSHTCGLRDNGAAVCWGVNSEGQASPPAVTFVSVSVGGRHSCGVRSNGSVSCWGRDDNGQANAPPGRFAQVTAGLLYTCGVRDDGSVECWGADGDGQATPPVIDARQGQTTQGGFISVAAGGDHSCGLKADLTLTCWGQIDPAANTPPGDRFVSINSGIHQTCGLRENGTVLCWSYDSFAAAYPPAQGRFSSVSAGWLHACGIRADGTLDCWGLSDIRTVPPSGQFTMVSAGSAHSCAVRVNGSVACWGHNTSGRATPLPGQFTSVAAGGHHSCGLRTDGTLACWGSNADGQITPPSGQFTSISSGSAHSCGLRANGTVACWGRNGSGESDAPPGQFSMVSAGTHHSCGLRVNGSIICWGKNDVGQATPPPSASTAP